jgi:hypothetical protein
MLSYSSIKWLSFVALILVSICGVAIALGDYVVVTEFSPDLLHFRSRTCYLAEFMCFLNKEWSTELLDAIHEYRINCVMKTPRWTLVSGWHSRNKGISGPAFTLQKIGNDKSLLAWSIDHPELKRRALQIADDLINEERYPVLYMFIIEVIKTKTGDEMNDLVQRLKRDVK